jgi:hypothetical protein
MMNVLRDEMRRSMAEARTAAVGWQKRTAQIKAENADLGDQVRIRLGDDQRRADLAKTHAWHASHASFLADVIQAEIALKEYDARARLRGTKGVPDAE